MSSVVGSKKSTFVLGDRPKGVRPATYSFIADIRSEDLAKLRHVVRRAILKARAPSMTDREIDRFIEGFAPDVLRRWLAVAVERKIID